jgi:hypothetical protein
MACVPYQQVTRVQDGGQQMLHRKILPLQKSVRPYVVLLPLALLVLSGCGVSLVYQDTFDSTPIGQPPGPPALGTASVSGDVRIAPDPFDATSSDHWLQLRRVHPLQLGEYVATLTEPVTAGTGGVAFVGYIPAAAPITMSVYFDTPAFAPLGTLLHIDLLPNRNIRVNDNTVEGTYVFNNTIGFLVSFNLGASPPTATLLIRGGAQDASTTVEIPAAVAAFGLGRVRLVAPFEGINSPPGQFLIDELVATRPTSAGGSLDASEHSVSSEDAERFCRKFSLDEICSMISPSDQR